MRSGLSAIVVAAVVAVVAVAAVLCQAQVVTARPAQLGTPHTRTPPPALRRLAVTSTSASPSALTFVPLTIGYAANDTAARLVAMAAAQALRATVAQAVDVQPAAVPVLAPAPATARDGVSFNATPVVLAVAAGVPMVRLDLAVPGADGGCEDVALDTTAIVTRASAATTLAGLDRAVWEAGAHSRVDVLGATGAVVRPGLYVPSFLLDTQPALATWEGLAQAGVTASVFAGALPCVRVGCA